VALVIVLFLSSGLLLPVSVAIQRYESNLQTEGIQSSVFFFVVLQGDWNNYGNSNPGPWNGKAAVDFFSQTIPSNPSQKGNDYYIRDGNTIIVFPQTLEESGSPPAIPFAPLLLVWLDSERRRSRFRIYVEILEVLKKRPLTSYEISFCLRLNSKRTRQYVDFLIEKGFLEFSIVDGKNVCIVTTNGKSFVDGMEAVLEKD